MMTPSVSVEHSTALGRSVVVAGEETLLRDVITSTLDDAGYTVEAIPYGEGMIEMLRAMGRAIDLLVVSSARFRASDWQTLESVVEMDRRPSVLLISAEPAVPPPHLAQYIDGTLVRPFWSTQLLEACARALDTSVNG
jgi:hypothetical protein